MRIRKRRRIRRRYKLNKRKYNKLKRGRGIWQGLKNSLGYSGFTGYF